jgi:antitoxin component YwqK of YwqJK toxin-antitoxin module
MFQANLQETYGIKGKKEGTMTDYYKDGKVKGERLFENDMQVAGHPFIILQALLRKYNIMTRGK